MGVVSQSIQRGPPPRDREPGQAGVGTGRRRRRGARGAYELDRGRRCATGSGSSAASRRSNSWATCRPSSGATTASAWTRRNSGKLWRLWYRRRESAIRRDEPFSLQPSGSTSASCCARRFLSEPPVQRSTKRPLFSVRGSRGRRGGSGPKYIQFPPHYSPDSFQSSHAPRRDLW